MSPFQFGYESRESGPGKVPQQRSSNLFQFIAIVGHMIDIDNFFPPFVQDFVAVPGNHSQFKKTISKQEYEECGSW